MGNLGIKKKLYIMILVMLLPIIINNAIEISNLFRRNIEIELKTNQDFAEAIGVSFINYLEKIRDFADLKMDIFMVLFLITSGLLLSIKIGRQIIQPITVLQDSAIKMSNGNLDTHTKVKGSDGIALAAQAFDKMAASIEEIYIESEFRKGTEVTVELPEVLVPEESISTKKRNDSQ